MSLQNLAKKVQSTGRGKDSMLVHMSPREVQGLQALAKVKGGQLTTNPKTGLPEAGFLEDILPMVAAGAAIYFTAGAATPFVASATGLGATGAGILAGAGAGALIGGGMSAIQGGDVGQGALMGGIGGAITGGMGGFGTGGEGAALEGAGTSALNPNASVGLNANIPVQASQGLTGAAQVNAGSGALIDPLAGMTGAPVPAGGYSGFTGGQALPSPNMPTSGFTPTANAINNAVPGQSVLPGASPNLAGTAPSVSGGAPTGGAPTGGGSSSDIGKWWSQQSPWEKAGYATTGAGLVAGMAAQANQDMGNVPDSSDDGDYLKRISPNFKAQQPIQPNPYYQAQYPTYLKRTQFAAEGGLMSLASGGPVEQMSQNMMGGQSNMFPQSQQVNTNFATPTQMPASAEVIRSDYDTKTDPYRGVMMAGGGIASLGGYSDGGRLLKGPGDGMSDHIPAQIGSKQPARLADGEFVVPADVVSHLGNGSTDAGAKRLYSMMDKVRTARTGKKKQAPAVNTNKLLPA